MSVNTSSDIVEWPPQHQVFINFRGKELRRNFISHLERALRKESINVFIDNHERMGRDLRILFTRIQESKIVVAVISSMYTESEWCLDELAKVKECVEAGTLEVFPVFYKVDVRTVREQRGTFGDNFRELVKLHPERDESWKQALEFVTTKKAKLVHEESDEGQVVENIVEEVNVMLAASSTDSLGRRNSDIAIGKKELLESSSSADPSPLFGIETRLEQLEEMLKFESNEITRIVGIVGMPGIGKTTLAKTLFEKWKYKFLHKMFLDDIRGKSEFRLFKRLHEDLLIGLHESQNNVNEQKNTKVSFKSLKAQIKKSKVFVVLDEVSDKRQIEEILGKDDWIKPGSKILITTSSKSSIRNKVPVEDIYLVPGLNENDALSQFIHHAFSGHNCSREGSFMNLSRQFVDYSRGHPLALKVLGGELCRKDEEYWKSKLGALSKTPSNTIQDVLQIPYSELTEDQKNVFLDVACFFRFDDEYHLRNLLDSSAENANEIQDLADKFLINISGGRVEMNDLLYTFAVRQESSSENSTNGRRLFNQGDIITLLLNKAEATKVRGIFLDMSEVPKKMSLFSDTFSRMKDLRYLKIFNSRCLKKCEDDCKLKFPEGLEFPLQEVRYLNWLKFPLHELPQDFDPTNLIDLKLPYSQIEQVWEGDKDTLKLKWLDLNHSSKLCTLSGLSHARNLQNMNLEGCTALKMVHQELQNMERLVFLNLRGCTSLESLPQMNLVSLKTLILSGCSNLEEFSFISENLEELYLDGTSIKGLPSTIGKLRRLIILILKDCKKLSSLPDSIGDLKAIQELILSGCSSLACFPEIKQNLKHLKTLLLDGTAIKEMPDILHRLSVNPGQTSSWSHCDMCEWPRGFYGLSSLRRLCLSKNEFIKLPSSIRDLFHLKWLDLKYCKKLVSVPMLPPNLQWLDAHGCISLEKIENPLALMLAETEHLHSTFIFSNCTKLDQNAENIIASYAQWKIQVMSNALSRYDESFVLDVLIGVCYPGWQVPAWFNHRSVGSVLEPKMPRHWSEHGLTGIALCVVVSFTDYKPQYSRFLVRCNCKFKEEDEPLIKFSCIMGGWIEHGREEPRTIESGHVFIGYTSWLHVKKNDRGGFENNYKGCFPSEASLQFEVTDGTRHVTNCEVLKCGFSMIYAPAEPVPSLCTDETQPIDDYIHDGSSSSSTTDIERNNRFLARYYNQRNGVSPVSPNMDIKIIEDVNLLVPSRIVKDTRLKGKSIVSSSTIRSNSKVVHRGETSASMFDSNLIGGFTTRESVRTDVEGITCSSFLQFFFKLLPKK
ncbi:PREDICTED: disease resistance protein RPS4-like [Camelina sativa]|uniref:ADP-ribosyl cyclase/cyclic ADP-ribose hydrolase n=1 Tax=Camelina sativa TaxID=90675 RepID=A0ABM0Y2W9_CAMSA|nr:PREDICTED: disease resistance protein RPS4-like [Camelina sativa]